MTTLLRYFHTLRHLRPIQVAARLRARLQSPVADTRAPPPRRSLTGIYEPVIRGAPSLVAENTFRFLNVERACTEAGDWRNPQATKLWLYHLHYFDDLNARDAEVRAAWHTALLRRWVDQNPPGAAIAWEPYPVSRRIVNWVKWSARGNELPPTCQASLAVQARWLNRRVEYHILGNHLLANASALVHAGLYFSGAEAQAWYEHGMRLITRELREQILSDGGHFERSTMYHAAVLGDLLDLINLVRAAAAALPADWAVSASRMHRWLSVMSHPDGEISFFNDAAFGIAPRLAELSAYAARLGLEPQAPALETLTLLQPSGYVRAVAGPAMLLCDCAPVGPDYLPGHAHADTLSFELSLDGQRLLVNSGTSRYGSDFERHRQRGTAAHNTVVVDGLDSSEVWGGFRVARRARPKLICAQANSREILIEASHDGYRRLSHGGEHTRRWALERNSLSIEDRLDGKFESAEAYFHLHPQVRIRAAGEEEVVLESAERMVRMRFSGAACVRVQPGTWHPRFGESIANCHLRVRLRAGHLQTRLLWGDERA